MVIEFIDGADAPMGCYYVLRHAGDSFSPYTCASITDSTHTAEVVGCEELGGASFDWTTSSVAFTPQFFENLSGPEIDPASIAMIRVWIESHNTAGAGVDAYFDNFAYEVVPPNR